MSTSTTPWWTADEEATKAILDITREGSTPEEVMEGYRAWAKTYDRDLTSLNATVGWQRIANEVTSYIADRKDARILDIACGTGALGKLFVSQGYHNVDGLDPSPEMLEFALATGAYKNLIKSFIGSDPTPGIESNSYDAVAVSGGFGIGHLKPSCIQEILRVMKPGTYFVSHSTQRYLESDYLKYIWDVIDKLCEEKKCELVKKEEIPFFDGRMDTMFVIKKL